MIDLKSLFLSPRGRIGRQTFLVAATALVAANLFVSLIPLLGPLVALPLLWPLACVTAKRLHDGNRSGMPAYAIALASLLVGAAAAAIGIMATDMSLVASAFGLAGVVLLLGGLTSFAGLGLIVWAAIKRGNALPNRFGPPEAKPLTINLLLNGGS